jgi:hypothetical protein
VNSYCLRCGRDMTPHMTDAWVQHGMCDPCLRTHLAEVEAEKLKATTVRFSMDEAASLPGLRSFVVEQEIIPRRRRIEGMLSW